VTRQATFDAATDDGQSLYRAAADLLAKNLPAKAVRLTGVSAHNLEPADAVQKTLLPAAPSARDALNRAMDAINSKFGSGSLTTADLTSSDDRDDRD
jgi:DNA polymerase-4